MGTVKFSLVILLFLDQYFCSAQQPAGSGTKDAVTRLPGVTFQTNFKQYAGYLNGDDGHSLFYWLIESQNSTTDPLILWLNGAPGCSSLTNLLLEIGPFRPNFDGRTLFENVYSWHKFANLLFIEAPTGSGFSYTGSPPGTKQDLIFDDDPTVNAILNALNDFMDNKFPQYRTRQIFVGGGSFSGYYTLALAKKIVDDKVFASTFKGVIVESGYLSEKNQTNTLVYYMASHGILSLSSFAELLSDNECRCASGANWNCDFYRLVSLDAETSCKTKVSNLLKSTDRGSDPYNIYHDCYGMSTPTKRVQTYWNRLQGAFKRKPKRNLLAAGGATPPSVKTATPFTHDIAHYTNYDFTDASLGFECWANESQYLNNKDVKVALHVDQSISSKNWASCNELTNYTRHFDIITTNFMALLKNSTLRFLFFNGDADSVSNFLGDLTYVNDTIVNNHFGTAQDNHSSWTYMNQIAGYRYSYNKVDVVTVKGAGHFVSMDRPGPAMQLVFNFVRGNQNFSQPTNIDTKPKQYNGVANAVSMTGPVMITAFAVAVLIGHVF